MAVVASVGRFEVAHLARLRARLLNLRGHDRSSRDQRSAEDNQRDQDRNSHPFHGSNSPFGDPSNQYRRVAQQTKDLTTLRFC
jgi:hypothetical protein